MPPSPVSSRPQLRQWHSWPDRSLGWSCAQLSGSGCSGLFITTESWLNAKAPPAEHLRAVQLLLGHTKLESTVRYLGIEVDDALRISEQVEL
jgi:hypothetical protein